MDHVAMIDFRGFVDQGLGRRHCQKPHRAQQPRLHVWQRRYPAGGRRGHVWYVRGAGRGLSQLDRAENQRNVLKAILTKGLSRRHGRRSAALYPVHRQRRQTRPRGQQLDRLRVRPGAIRLLAVPLENERKIAGQRVHPVNSSGLAALSQALRTDNMANYMQK
jgi:hypothetical protein